MKQRVQRFGRRGAMLMLFACIYAAYGGALTTPRITPSGVELLTGRLPPMALVVPWVISAALAAAAALPWRAVPQWLGFTALMPIPAVWALSYAASWLMWLALGVGNQAGWAGALIWGLLVGVIAVVAGWPEASPTPEPRL